MINEIFRPTRPIPRAIFDRLTKEQERRSTNKNWLRDELIALWEATNYQRAILGKGPVALLEVEAAERMAMGHVDYTQKCAYYCERLVSGARHGKDGEGAT